MGWRVGRFLVMGSFVFRKTLEKLESRARPGAFKQKPQAKDVCRKISFEENDNEAVQDKNEMDGGVAAGMEMGMGMGMEMAKAPQPSAVKPIVRKVKRSKRSGDRVQPIQKSLDKAVILMDELLKSAGDLLPS